MIFKIIFITLCTSLIACGSTDASSLRGTWSTQDSSMVAHIYKKSIRIDHKFDDGDLALYWKGTFRSSLSDGESFRSKPDVNVLKYVLFGSTAKSKKFTYQNNRLSFQFSILGTTRRIYLIKKS